MDDQTKLRLVDVGGAGGIQDKWLPFQARLIPVLFEPNPWAATQLRTELADAFPEALVVEAALSDREETRQLHITHFWGCSSLLRPNAELLRAYRIGALFDVVDSVDVACVRYDMLHGQGRVPAPDAIKVDVQGFEYEVLTGFGDLLHDCLAVELETHFYELYEGQKLLHDLVALLRPYGLVLRTLRPVNSFDGDLVEADAFFTKDKAGWMRLSPERQQHFSLICRASGLLDYARIVPGGHHHEFLPE